MAFMIIKQYSFCFYKNPNLVILFVNREFAKKHVKKERARERAELAKAWNLLDPLGHGSLSCDDQKLVKLFKILRPQVRYVCLICYFIFIKYCYDKPIINNLSFGFEQQHIGHTHKLLVCHIFDQDLFMFIAYM